MAGSVVDGPDVGSRGYVIRPAESGTRVDGRARVAAAECESPERRRWGPERVRGPGRTEQPKNNRIASSDSYDRTRPPASAVVFSSADRAHLPRWSLRCSLTHVRVRSLRSSLPPCIWTLSADELAPPHPAHLPRLVAAVLAHARVRSFPPRSAASRRARPIPGPSAALVAAVLAHARPSARDPCAKPHPDLMSGHPMALSRQRTVRDSAGASIHDHTRGKRSPRCRSTTRRGADGRRCY